MLERMAKFSIRRRRIVMSLTMVLAILAGVFGTAVFSKVTDGGFLPEDAPSLRAAQILGEEFDIASPNFLVLVDGNGKSADDASVTAEGKRLAASLATEPGISEVSSYWTTPGATALKSTDGTKALITADLRDDNDTIADLVEKYSTNDNGIAVMVGGGEAIGDAISGQVSSDLAKAESIALPVVIILMIFVFGGLVAAGMPLIVGMFSILGAFLLLYGFTFFTDVSVFSVNLVTMLGLGLGIDYSLFVVSRYREELKHGLEQNAAIIRSITTAGRTVVFSAVAICISLSAMLVFPVYFLRSFAYAGISTVFIAAIVSIVFLPALLAAVGPRINRFQVIKHTSVEDPSPFWGGVGRFVMRRPAVVAVATTLVLLVLAAPFLSVKWGPTDDRVLPKDAPSHLVSNALRNDFPQRDDATLTVVTNPGANAAAAPAYAEALSRVENVKRIDAPSGSFVNGRFVDGSQPQPQYVSSNGTLAFSVVMDVEAFSPAATDVAKDVRDIRGPFVTYTAGAGSEQVDSNAPILKGLLPAALVLLLGSFIILFLMTGSVVIPLKAIVMAGLSLTASLGAVVWIFQDGHFSDFLGFTPTGSIDHTNVIVMFCIAFGLSMDYEVFLVSRIKEEHDRSGDTRQAITAGLERTGRLVTAAALLISVVFLSFATSGIAFIKLIGLGLAISIIVDATIVRGLLVPAFMRLMGEANWWAPAPLKRLHARIGISEGSSVASTPSMPEVKVANLEVAK